MSDGPLTLVARGRLVDWSANTAATPSSRAKTLEERLEGCFGRIREVDGEVRAFCTGSPDEGLARGTAAAFGSRIESDDGVLFDGAPVAIKDIIAVEGYPRQGGSLLPPEALAASEASVVRRLRSLGCLPVGVSETTEFAWFFPAATRNPQNLNHTPGGSSSGSAAAVAAGMVPLGVGTQTIGSVIRPASFCGIVGYKPTFGLLPRDGVLSVSRTLDHLGFFTQDLEGMRLLAQGLGLLPKASGSAAEELPRIVFVGGSYLGQAEPGILSVLDRLFLRLEEARMRPVWEDLFDDIDTINALHRTIYSREFYHAHYERWQNYGGLYRPASRDLFLAGEKTSVTSYEAAMEEREGIIGDLESDYPATKAPVVWVSPAAPGTAPLGLESTGSPIMNLPWTFWGTPALTIPMGSDQDLGLPYGVQLTAPRGADHLLFALAAALEPLLPA